MPAGPLPPSRVALNQGCAPSATRALDLLYRIHRAQVPPQRLLEGVTSLPASKPTPASAASPAALRGLRSDAAEAGGKIWWESGQGGLTSCHSPSFQKTPLGRWERHSLECSGTFRRLSSWPSRCQAFQLHVGCGGDVAAGCSVGTPWAEQAWVGAGWWLWDVPLLLFPGPLVRLRRDGGPPLCCPLTSPSASFPGAVGVQL